MGDKAGNKFGEILSPGGAIFRVRSWHDAAFVKIESTKARMRMNGISITPEIDKKLNELAEQDVKKWQLEFELHGIPEVFNKLFSLSKKLEVERFTKKLIISRSEFAYLVHNHKQIGLTHTRLHLQKIPNHLITTPVEEKAFKTNGVGPFKTKEARKFSKKLSTIFAQRKNTNAHLFEAYGQWHLFWFTFNDIYGTKKMGKNHWEGGDHIHYTSYLWGHQKEVVWEQLKQKEYGIDGIHIRYQDIACDQDAIE